MNNSTTLLQVLLVLTLLGAGFLGFGCLLDNCLVLPWGRHLKTVNRSARGHEATYQLISHNQQIHKAEVDERVSRAEAEVAELTEKLHTLRKEYGRLHCSVHGIGPTGGFCLNKTKDDVYDVGGNSLVDHPVCKELAANVLSGTILDLGCSWGLYGECLREQNPSLQWVGYDGAEGIEEATKGRVKFMDLSVRQDLRQRWTWVMSLEVGEHLPARYEDTFIENVVRHAHKGVLLSWAVPGQVGHFHVNCRTNEYVIKKMAARGFKYDAETSERLRDMAELRWFRNTVMLFRRVDNKRLRAAS